MRAAHVNNCLGRGGKGGVLQNAGRIPAAPRLSLFSVYVPGAVGGSRGFVPLKYMSHFVMVEHFSFHLHMHALLFWKPAAFCLLSSAEQRRRVSK